MKVFKINSKHLDMNYDMNITINLAPYQRQYLERERPMNVSINQEPQQRQLKNVESAFGFVLLLLFLWGTQQSQFKLISTTRARARARTLGERKAHMPQGHRHLRGCLLHTYVLGQVG